jgi:hypothetical protein
MTEPERSEDPKRLPRTCAGLVAILPPIEIHSPREVV